MFGSNSLSVPLHAIQSDLSQLENQLLRFKIVSTQSPLSHALAQNDLNFQLSSQLEAVKASFTSFCMKFQEQIRNLQSRLNLVVQVSSGFVERKEWSENQKYLMVTEKINVLEQSLKRTQQNQNKLIQAINLLMAKYQIEDQPTMIQNDQYLRSRIKTSQSSSPSLITFQPCSGAVRQVSLDKSSSTRQNLTQTMKKNQGNIYLLANESPHLRTPNNDSPQYLRTFSKPSHGLKISLKHTSGASQPLKSPINSSPFPSRTYDLKDNRGSSLNNHEHRFKFMMENLNY